MFRQKEKEVNIYFFVGRGIGVALLGIYALDAASAQISKDKKVNRFLIFTEESSVYEDLVIPYGNIKNIYLRPNRAKSLVFLYFNKCFRENIFLYHPSFTRPKLIIRLFSFFLTRLILRSKVIGFVEKNGFQDRLLYDVIIEMNRSDNIFESVYKMTASNKTTTSPFSPALLYEHDVFFAKTLPRHYVVYHPFATHESRTYPDTLSINLLNHLLKTFSKHEVILSGGPADEVRARKLLEKTDDPDRIHFTYDLTQGSFPKLIQLIAQSDLYIGVDTGITHVAANLNTKSIVLGNQSNPMWLPDYSKTATVLVNKEVCKCDGKKGGACFKEFEGKSYYACMLEISWQKLCLSIECALH